MCLVRIVSKDPQESLEVYWTNFENVYKSPPSNRLNVHYDHCVDISDLIDYNDKVVNGLLSLPDKMYKGPDKLPSVFLKCFGEQLASMLCNHVTCNSNF